MCKHSLTPPARPLSIITWTIILMQIIWLSNPTSLRRPMIWLVYYWRWKSWKSRIMINSVQSSWPKESVILAQAFIKSAMESCATDIHRYLDYCKLSYHKSPTQIMYLGSLPQVGRTRWRHTNECLSTAYLLLRTGSRLCHLFCPRLRAFCKNLGLSCAHGLASWNSFLRLNCQNPCVSIS